MKKWLISAEFIKGREKHEKTRETIFIIDVIIDNGFVNRSVRQPDGYCNRS